MKQGLWAICVATAFHAPLFSQLDGSVTAPSVPIFTEVTEEVGIDLNHIHAAVNFHSHGIAVFDCDGDGWEDLFVSNGLDGEPQFYLADGDGTFTKRNDLLPSLPNYEMSGVIAGDYDNDGDTDLYITTDSEEFELFDINRPDGFANILLRNNFVENGGALGGTLFSSVAWSSGATDKSVPPLGTLPGQRAMTAAWIDHDRDGDLDLFVGHMILQEGGNAINRDSFYRNLGDGTFEDATAEVMPFLIGDEFYYRPTLASIGAHLDNDMWPDMYIACVHEPTPHHFDYMLKNRGDGSFMDITSLSPIGDDSGAAMGIDVADVDLDGDWDIYISDKVDSDIDASLGNPFYLSNGDGTWTDTVALESGVFGETSWGVNFFDIDQDCYEDLFVGVLAGVDLMYMNNGDTTFTDVSAAAGFNAITKCRGSVTGDFDHDGDLDLITVSEDMPVRYYRNDTENQGHWLQLKLRGTRSNRDAIGSLVEVDVDGLTMMRQVKGGVERPFQHQPSRPFRNR